MAVYPLKFDLPDTLPETLPVLPLRGGVLMPGAIMPIPIGRRSTGKALDAAEEGLVLVAVQRDSGEARPGPILVSLSLPLQVAVGEVAVGDVVRERQPFGDDLRDVTGLVVDHVHP